MFVAYLDASALAKRYIPELGTATVNYLFARLPPDQMVLLTVGLTEVVSVFVRRRNARRLSATAFSRALIDFDTEIMAPPAPHKVLVDVDLVSAAIPLIQTHSINGTDALVLRSALDLAAQLRSVGNDLFLVACDLRLLRASQAEGLITFDPERQSQADLDAILGP